MIQKQQAKEKLHKLVAPLLAMHNADQLSLQALGAIHPKLNLSFSEVGATLRDGSIILQGVTGHFKHAKVLPAHGSVQDSCVLVQEQRKHKEAACLELCCTQSTSLPTFPLPLLLWPMGPWVLLWLFKELTQTAQQLFGLLLCCTSLS